MAEATGNQMDRYFTFTQRSGALRIPVRTLDYLFAAPTVTIERYSVQQEGMMKVSDHLPSSPNSLFRLQARERCIESSPLIKLARSSGVSRSIAPSDQSITSTRSAFFRHQVPRALISLQIF